MRLRALIGWVAVLALLAPASSAASARHRTSTRDRTPKPLALSLSWHLAFNSPSPSAFAYVRTLGEAHRYVLISYWGASGTTVIDDDTGQQQSLNSIEDRVCSTPGYSSAPLAMGSLGDALALFDHCGPDGPADGWATVYSLSNGNWTRLDYGQKSTVCSADCTMLVPGSQPGAYWVAYGWPTPYCPEHCGSPPPPIYQNIYTGQWAAAPQTSQRKLLDLDSPGLTRSVCRPLRLPADQTYDFYFYGAFAVWLRPTAPHYDGPLSSWLQRCGSRKRVPLHGYWGATGDPRLLISQDYSRRTPPFRLVGSFLPSLQQFDAPLPRPLQSGIATIVLGTKRVYAVNRQETQVWTAPRPTRPRHPQ